MSTHTPGPWKVQRNGLGQSIGVTDADDHPISMACGDPFNAAQPCTNPNARLIAAAPEMLEILHLLREPALDHSERLAGCRVLAGALLARIEGESDA